MFKTNEYFGGRVDVGAYGGTSETSKSPRSSGPEPPQCIHNLQMDFNNDCKVDMQDFAIFCESWLDCGLEPASACW